MAKSLARRQSTAVNLAPSTPRETRLHGALPAQKSAAHEKREDSTDWRNLLDRSLGLPGRIVETAEGRVQPCRVRSRWSLRPHGAAQLRSSAFAFAACLRACVLMTGHRDLLLTTDLSIIQRGNAGSR